ncbi:MAG: hypothetical protein KKD17_00070 [Nanoarchaeota archaeon]|nr:hypothetical protein [Nanoarchaeota archaeon]
MGFIKKALLYGGLVAIGMGACYFSCVDRKYEVVEHCGELYVKHRPTGLMAGVDADFERIPLNPGSGTGVCAARDGITERIEDAYKALTR